MPEKKYSYVRKTKMVNGVRYEAKGKTEREADRKLKAMLDAANVGLNKDNAKTTVKEWADIWVDKYLKPKVRKPGTQKLPGTMGEKNLATYTTAIDNHIVPAIGKKRIADVTEWDLREILNQQAGKSYSFVCKLRMVIQSMFRQARISRVIAYDPAEFLELPVSVKGKGRALTPEEREAFFKAAQHNRHGTFFRFLLATGLRPAECAALKIENLDLKRLVVHVYEAVEAGTNIVGSPKTKAGERFTVINDKDLIPELKAIIKGRKKTDYLFTQTDGKSMLTETCIRQRWKSFTRQMDIEMGAKTKYRKVQDSKLSDSLVLYCLRHSFGTDMQRGGVPMDVTKYLMGHEDIATTANIYVDYGEPEAIRATKILFPAK